MDRAELDITITRSGQVNVEVRGAKGPKCLKFADLIRQIVGRERQRRLTQEYYEPDVEVRLDTHNQAHRGK